MNLFCVNENGKYINFINIFLWNYLEICCSLCYIKNLHNKSKTKNINKNKITKISVNKSTSNNSNNFIPKFKTKINLNSYIF